MFFVKVLEKREGSTPTISQRVHLYNKSAKQSSNEGQKDSIKGESNVMHEILR